MKTLVTGAAGFIGFYTARALLDRGDDVVGFDNLNPYCDVNLKKDRLAQLSPDSRFSFVKGDLADKAAVDAVLADHRPERVIHLAAQAGIRHSLTHPEDYVRSNLVGFSHVLEACRHAGVAHLVFASSSSVYGANTRTPFSVRLYNIGNHSPVPVMDFIACIEKALGRNAEMNLLPAQPGEVPLTFADVTDLQADLGYAPRTPIDEGVAKFVAWYRNYYKA